MCGSTTSGIAALVNRNIQRTASDNRGVPQLEDDECGWDAAGLLGTLAERALHVILLGKKG